MSNGDTQRDLVVLVADSNMASALRGLLGRHHSLRIRQLIMEIFVHPERDPGCLLRGADFLRSSTEKFTHALILLDHEGSGQEDTPGQALEAEIERELAVSGWGDRAAAVVIEPELDIWVWSDSPAVDSVIRWENEQTPLRQWLCERGFLRIGETKPDRPKEALESALREVRIPRSSSMYRQLAERVSLDRCIDPSFARLKLILQRWFSADDVQ